jgi:hypothetical protein
MEPDKEHILSNVRNFKTQASVAVIHREALRWATTTRNGHLQVEFCLLVRTRNTDHFDQKLP